MSTSTFEERLSPIELNAWEDPRSAIPHEVADIRHRVFRMQDEAKLNPLCAETIADYQKQLLDIASAIEELASGVAQ